MRDDVSLQAGQAAAPRLGSAVGARTGGLTETEQRRAGRRPARRKKSLGADARLHKLRQDALDAAATLFAEQHVARADVDAVLNLGDGPQRSAGSLFASREILFAAVVERERLKLIAALVSPLGRGEVTAGARTLSDACTMIVSHVFDYHRSRPLSLRLVFGGANRDLTVCTRREVTCLVRLAVEQCLAKHVRDSDGATIRALSTAVTTSALALSDLVVDDRDEARRAVVAALGLYGAHSAA